MQQVTEDSRTFLDPKIPLAPGPAPAPKEPDSKKPPQACDAPVTPKNFKLRSILNRNRIFAIGFLSILFYLYNKYSLQLEGLLFDQAYKNICLNGKPKSSLTLTQQLIEFIKGPCSPILFIPGILATRLRIEIDCKLLQKEDPQTFENCNWNTCTDYGYWPFSRKPYPEYDIWLPSFWSKISFFLPRNYVFRDICFASLIKKKYRYSETEDVRNITQDRPGLRLTWYGDTPETSDHQLSECGKTALSTLSAFFPNFYYKILDFYEYMGYTHGLTLQGVPYDWRETCRIGVSGKILKPL
jgi:hypothetical protein